MVTDADRGRKAASVSLPAPTLGVNSRDALANMDPRYAVSMVNMFPTTSGVDLRKGWSQKTYPAGALAPTFLGGFVPYGISKLFASMYDSGALSSIISEIDSVTTTAVAAVLAGDPSYSQLANSAGSFVAVILGTGGALNYWTYDGTTWTDRTAATSGSGAFVTVTTHRNRLWFTKATGLDAFYLPTQAITGTPISFPLGGVASRGGTLQYVSTWTVDGGEGGSDDLIVFVTSAGQVIVYSGTDPSSSSTWALVGVFNMSIPVSYKPVRLGADLLLPMEDGLFSMTQILQGKTGGEFAVSDAIRGDWQELASARWGNVTACYSSKINHLMINFPTAAIGVGVAPESVQLVMNAVSKAWTKYTSLDCWSLVEFGGDIYMGYFDGSRARIRKWGTATDDNGSAITGYCQQAYTTMGAAGTQKLVTALKPSFTTTGTHTVGFAVDVDYKQAITTSTSPTNDRSYAAGSYAQVLHYPTIGESLSVFCEVSSSASGFSWYSTGLLTMAGGFV